MDQQRKQFRLETKALGERQLRFIASTETPDRERDVIKLSGWELGNFRQTGGPILWGHNPSIPPIAKASSIGIEGQALVMTAQFPRETLHPLSDQIYELAKERFVNSASVGFIPLEYNFDEQRRGYNFIRQELAEVSLTSTPANPEAVQLALRKGLTWPGNGGTMRDDEVFDIDEATVRQAVRAVVRAQIMALTGRLDEGERPRRATQGPSSGDFIEVAPPRTPYEERLNLGYTYAGVEKMLRQAGIRNSALDELRRHHDAQGRR